MGLSLWAAYDQVIMGTGFSGKRLQALYNKCCGILDLISCSMLVEV